MSVVEHVDLLARGREIPRVKKKETKTRHADGHPPAAPVTTLNEGATTKLNAALPTTLEGTGTEQASVEERRKAYWRESFKTLYHSYYEELASEALVSS